MNISKDNNTPELAYNSLYSILERENKEDLQKSKLKCTVCEESRKCGKI